MQCKNKRYIGLSGHIEDLAWRGTGSAATIAPTKQSYGARDKEPGYQ